MRIALKIDVDTWRGTREGVPALARTLERHDAGASFLFSLGPDHTGRALRRALRPGFMRKVARTSVLEHYGLRTLLHGTLLPGPDIGRREAPTLRAVAAAGFEVGVHCWDHVRWQDGVADADETWTRREMERAVQRFGEVFARPPRHHGAAGWQMNEHAYRLDARGHGPYRPVDARGHVIGPVQWPTTLPTLDELLGADGLTTDNVDRHLLRLTENQTRDQVYTLHAELEGQKLLPVFERLLAGWRAQGHSLQSIESLHANTDPAALPHCRATVGTLPGRSGPLAVQGEALAT
jgi:undecaprenyl phosphate-alpha-L-ara4FN deformylase